MISKLMTRHHLVIVSILLISFALRVVNLQHLPPSPYWEEVALGYDAYSILKTGKDHHGHLFPLVAFESFGDYKPSGYFYAIVPFIALIGLSVFAVRLPSTLAGVAIVYFSGAIAKLLFHSEIAKQAHSWKAILLSPQILTMIVTAFSPWALQFSRGGWEVNLATCFLTIGVYSALRAAQQLQTKGHSTTLVFQWYFIGFIFFILSTYTYHSTRIIAPLLGIVTAIPLLKQAAKYKLTIAALLFLGILTMLPILYQIKDPAVTHRLQETSAFTTQQEIDQSNQLITQFGSTRLARIVFHRDWFYLKTFLSNYFSHFRLDYLFLSGDNNTRHSTHFFGLFFPTDLVVLALGVIAMVTQWKHRFHLLWIWLGIGLIPSALTKDVPHALRTLPVLPVYMVTLGIGFTYLFEQLAKLRFSKLLFAGISFIVLAEIIVYWHFHFTVYPTYSSKEWQYGYQQMIAAIKSNQQTNEAVFITTEKKRPAMYYWFFTKTDPVLVQAEENTAQKDQGEFLSFQNIKFIFHLSGSEQGLIASGPEQRKNFPNAQELATITDLQGHPIWIVYRAQ